MTDGSETGCAYTFDADEWEERTGRQSPLASDRLDGNGNWHCNREPHGNTDRCLFHLPPEKKDPEAVRSAFLTSIEERGARAKQFVGARFGPLDLDREIVACADNHEIDLRHATFEGATSWRYAIVRQPVAFDGATFTAGFDCTEATFEQSVSFDAATFAAPSAFFETTFEGSCTAYGTAFDRGDFHGARFDGLVDFSESTFEDAQFRETYFGGVTRFKLASFEGASFTGARFADRVYFDEATLPTRFNVKKADVEDLLSFERVQLADGHCWVDMTATTVAAGRLYLPETGRLVYDLADATVGEVSLADGVPRPSLFDHFRFQNTTFEGFDFGSYRSVLHAAEWKIHEIHRDERLVKQPGKPAPNELETTYLKAKNGANAIGDTKAAAEFFRLEMLYRRAQYLPAEPGRWVANALLDLTAGYGERPSRVVAVSVGTVFAFGGVFALLRSEPLYDTPVGYLVLSLQSFITLVLGGAEDVGGPWIRLLAQVEGFIGAFLIALFVFTLTRSIHR